MAHHDGDPAEMARRHLDRLSDVLDLTPQQRDTMEVVLQESIRDLLAAQEEVGEARRALRDLFLAAEIDSTEVLQIVARLTDARGRVERLVSRNMIREAALLTREQRERYVEALPWQHGPGKDDPRRPRPEPR
jgi:Spy/CpxP family protein refolding chaperone